MKTQLVSIIVPCYYQAQFLDEALQSILGQTYTNWECIIVNDGSPDNTEEVAQKWMAKDARFQYVYKENGGLSSARNTGIAIAVGEFILPLDADDKIGGDYIKLALQAFQEDNTLKVVYCKAEKFGDIIGEWNLPNFSLSNLAANNIIFCSALFRKKEWEFVQGYDEKMLYGLEDWEFWIAVLKDGGGVKCLDYVGFYYRVKPNSMLQTLNSQKRKYLFNYMSVKHVDFFVKECGSFIELNNQIHYNKLEYLNKLKSKKFVIDVFCKTFLGFTLFEKYKK